MSAGSFAVVDGLLNFFKNAEWIAKHLPDSIKPTINPYTAIALGAAAVLLAWRGKTESNERPPSERSGLVGIKADGDVNITNLNYSASGVTTGQSATPAPQKDVQATRAEQKNGPRLIAKYADSRVIDVPGEELEFHGSVVAFRNDANESHAVDVITHLTFRHKESGGQIEVNEALWNERNMSSVDIYRGKTLHLAIAVQIPDSSPVMFITFDVEFAPRSGGWQIANARPLAYGHYDLLIEVKAKNYRVFFECTGELSETKNTWSIPVQVSEERVRAAWN